MSDAEKRLRSAIVAVHMSKPSAREKRLNEAQAAVDVLLTEHRAALARARAEALEEAAQRLERLDCPRLADDIRILAGAPAPASIPVESVRGALLAFYSGANVCSRRDLLDCVAARLGVSLDAATEDVTPTTCGKRFALGLCRLRAGHDGAHHYETEAPRPTGVDLRALAACSHGRVWPEECPECGRRS